MRTTHSVPLSHTVTAAEAEGSGGSPASVGIFSSIRSASEALQRLRALGLDSATISVFTPGSSKQDLLSIPTSDTEQGGMGPALAGSVLGALGLGVGVLLFIPGLGPVSLLGALAAGALGVGSAAVGAAVGAKLERESLKGLLPVDELYLYEDALAQGKTIVVIAPPEEMEKKAVEALKASGAESIDAARESWWVGIRDSHKLTYASPERKALWDDPRCRRGFELAIRQGAKGLNEVEGKADLERTVPPAERTEAFWLGYIDGRAYCRRKEGANG